VNSRQPPRLAVWLSRSTGLTRQNEPLAGDLLEEFRNGRTTGCYWRQTLMAVLTAFVHRVSDLRLDLQVLIIGWGTQTVFLLALWWYRVPFGPGSIAFVLGAALACYASMEITARALIERDDLGEAEFSEQLCRAVFPRVMAVGWLVTFMFLDGWTFLVMKIGPLLEKWLPILAVGPDIRPGLPLLFAAKIFALSWFVVKILSSSSDSPLRVRRR